MINTFGRFFRVTTFGESHGVMIGVVVDGCPPGIALSEEDIQRELNRRRPGQSELVTGRKEADLAEIVSGIFRGETTGTPICVLVHNRDQRPNDYEALKNLYRPGHADFTYEKKYGARDYRGSGRASGRETIGRVIAGAIAGKLLREMDVYTLAYTVNLGGISSEHEQLFPAQDITLEQLDNIMEQIESSPVRCPDPKASGKMAALVEEMKQEGDSVGGVVEARVYNLPAGWGDPVFDKAEALLGHAILSIGAVKGIEFGAGFRLAEMRGSMANDRFQLQGKRIVTTTNHAGGILGGITNGMPLVFRAVVKPTSSIGKRQRTLNREGREVEFSISGRHDPCIVIRIVPVIAAMTNIVLADLYLSQKTLKS